MTDKATIITAAATITISTVGALLFYLYRAKKPKEEEKIALKGLQVDVPLKLIEKHQVTHNTFKFKFALPSEEHILGLPTGKHIYLSAKIDGRIVVRPYTPISSDDDKGFVELMVKVYFEGIHPNFPDGGKMSQHLYNMAIEDSITFRGPSGYINYRGDGYFKMEGRRISTMNISDRHVRQISMIAGGSGITPMLQIINAVLKNPNDNTKLALIFANQSTEDILCRAELDKLARDHEKNFRLWYTVDKADESWSYSTGWVNEQMISEHLFAPSRQNIVLLCGPPAMVSLTCSPNLVNQGHDEKNIYLF